MGFGSNDEDRRVWKGKNILMKWFDVFFFLCGVRGYVVLYFCFECGWEWNWDVMVVVRLKVIFVVWCYF